MSSAAGGEGLATSGCPVYAPFFGFAGVSLSMVLASAGASYGTAKAGSAIAAVGVAAPHIVMSALIPIVMAGILTIYGLVISVFISTSMDPDTPYPLFSGALHLASGLSVGLCSLASGYAIGVVGDAGVRGLAKQPRLFVGLVLILIFAEVLGLYGLLGGILMHGKTRGVSC